MLLHIKPFNEDEKNDLLVFMIQSHVNFYDACAHVSFNVQSTIILEHRNMPKVPENESAILYMQEECYENNFIADSLTMIKLF